MDKFKLRLASILNKVYDKLPDFRWSLLVSLALIAILGGSLIVPSSGEASPPPPKYPTKGKKDTTSPYVSSINRRSPPVERTDSDTLRWTIVFSEDVLNVDESDFVVDGTTASLSVTSMDTYLDSVYFATLSGGDLPDLNGTVSINVASKNDITDGRGNPLASFPPMWNRNTYTVMNVIPPRLLSIERKSPDVLVTNVDSLTWRLSFDKPVILEASNIRISGAPGVIRLTTVTPEMVVLSGEAICKCELETISPGMVYDVMFSGPDDASMNSLADYNGSVSIALGWERPIIDADGVPLANLVPDGVNETVFTLDNVTPVLEEVSVVKTPRDDVAPEYAFSSTEAGEITYGGSCASSWMTAHEGVNNVPFNPLSVGEHSDCTVTVTDAAGNASAPLPVTAFTIDTTAPRLASIERSWPNTETTAADALMWVITFSEPVINVDPADFDVSGSVANVIGIAPVGLGEPGTPSSSYFVAVQGGDLDLLNGVVTLTIKDERNIADSAGNPLTNESPTGTNDNTFTMANLGPDPAPPRANNMAIRNVHYNSINLGSATKVSETFSPEGVLLATFEPHPRASLTCAEGEPEHGWYNKITLLTRTGADGRFTNTGEGMVYQAITIPASPGEYMLLAYCVNGDQRSDALTLWSGSITLKSSE